VHGTAAPRRASVHGGESVSSPMTQHIATELDDVIPEGQPRVHDREREPRAAVPDALDGLTRTRQELGRSPARRGEHTFEGLDEQGEPCVP